MDGAARFFQQGIGRNPRRSARAFPDRGIKYREEARTFGLPGQHIGEINPAAPFIRNPHARLIDDKTGGRNRIQLGIGPDLIIVAGIGA